VLRVCTRLQVCRLLRGRGLLRTAAVCQWRILGMGLSAPVDSVIFICSSHTAPSSAVNCQTLRTMSCHICGMEYQLSETEYLSFPNLINPCQTSSLVVPHHEAFTRRDHAHLLVNAYLHHIIRHAKASAGSSPCRRVRMCKALGWAGFAGQLLLTHNVVAGLKRLHSL